MMRTYPTNQPIQNFNKTKVRATAEIKYDLLPNFGTVKAGSVTTNFWMVILLILRAFLIKSFVARDT